MVEYVQPTPLPYHQDKMPNFGCLLGNAGSSACVFESQPARTRRPRANTCGPGQPPRAQRVHRLCPRIARAGHVHAIRMHDVIKLAVAATTCSLSTLMLCPWSDSGEQAREAWIVRIGLSCQPLLHIGYRQTGGTIRFLIVIKPVPHSTRQKAIIKWF